MSRTKIVVIVGPTASGKSYLAVKLAKKFNGEIISADSRQVYKGLNVGSGKITKQEMKGVPHRLLDVANPKKRFSVSEYKKLAYENIQHVTQSGNLPIIVGGTGFYIDALTGSINFPDVPPNKTLRSFYEKLNVRELFKMLTYKDYSRACTIGPYNKVRLIRALEIINTLGHIPVLTPSVNKNLGFIFVGLSPEKDDLKKLILVRLIRRLPEIIRECKRLHKQGLTWKRMHELGLEYRYVAMYLQNKLSREEMIEKLNNKTVVYAKRQMTWFKRNKKIKWFKPDKYKELERYVGRMLEYPKQGD